MNGSFLDHFDGYKRVFNFVSKLLLRVDVLRLSAVIRSKDKQNNIICC